MTGHRPTGFRLGARVPRNPRDRLSLFRRIERWWRRFDCTWLDEHVGLGDRVGADPLICRRCLAVVGDFPPDRTPPSPDGRRGELAYALLATPPLVARDVANALEAERDDMARRLRNHPIEVEAPGLRVVLTCASDLDALIAEARAVFEKSEAT